MGCDIHIYREKKINGAWVTADHWADEYDEGRLSVPYKMRAYSGRNYDLFGFLSDGVRNTVPGAFSPRDTPADASSEVAQEVARWDGDGHSHSWLGLDELRAAQGRMKTSTTPTSGLMHCDQLTALNASIASGTPDWSLLYPHWQGGGDVATTVRFSVDVPSSFSFGGALQEIIDSFDGIDGDEHRIVFFFDN